MFNYAYENASIKICYTHATQRAAENQYLAAVAVALTNSIELVCRNIIINGRRNAARPGSARSVSRLGAHPGERAAERAGESPAKQ